MKLLHYQHVRNLVLMIAVLLRVPLVWIASSRVPPTADGHFYHLVAQRIAEGHGYTWLWPDGVVTAAAHYPVGYPALLSVFYYFFGFEHIWAMCLNAGLGVLLTWSVLELSFLRLRPSCNSVPAFLLSKSERNSLFVVGVLTAALPSLLFYTPALMTEGAVAALLIFSLLVAAKMRRYSFPSKNYYLWALAGLVALVGATFLRPQTIALIPAFGFVSSRKSLSYRLALTLAVPLLVLGCCLPWVLRNCDQMGQCLFISANGGWNLLIGTFAEGNGAWVALEGVRIPADCINVFDEAAKDSCFGKVGVERILSAPLSWLSLAPDKWRATFDYSNVAAGHLLEAGAIQEQGYTILSLIELVSNRLVLFFLLLRTVLIRLPDSYLGTKSRIILFVVGTFGCLGFGVILTLCASLVAALSVRRPWRDESLFVFCWSALVTIVIHCVFFGAARYGLPLLALALPNLVPLSQLSFGRNRKEFSRAFDTPATSR